MSKAASESLASLLEELRLRRRQEGLSYKALAEAAGYDPASVWRLLNPGAARTKKPNAMMLADVQRVLGVTGAQVPARAFMVSEQEVVYRKPAEKELLERARELGVVRQLVELLRRVQMPKG